MATLAKRVARHARAIERKASLTRRMAAFALSSALMVPVGCGATRSEPVEPLRPEPDSVSELGVPRFEDAGAPRDIVAPPPAYGNKVVIRRRRPHRAASGQSP